MILCSRKERCYRGGAQQLNVQRKNRLKAEIKSVRSMIRFIFKEFVGVCCVKSVTEDFHCGGFLSAQMQLFNLRSFYINSCHGEIIRLGIPRLSKENQNNTMQ